MPALHLGVSCDSMCLEGSTPGAPAARFSHKSTFNAVLANTEKNQSYNHRCLEWTRERQLNQCLTHQGREKIKLPSMQGRKNRQGTENMEKLCKNFFLKIYSRGRKYIQILTYKHSWNHKETAALGEKIWSTLSAGLQVISSIFTSYFCFSAFFKQVKLFQLIKSKQGKKAPEFKKKSVCVPWLINRVKNKCINVGGSKKILNLTK